ncbi:MAG: ATP-dependent DNA helicase, partial [Bifidobacteriaceae bacterium]|nr:ATP-dependent DNA helicase [Bifidobacteriaceae bacterium]
AAAQAELRHAAVRRREEVQYAQAVLAGGAGSGLVSAEQLADRFASTGPSLTLAERAGADRAWTYGHIVVDEAQELTPMDWRALLRRCPTRSLTIVGDAGQTRSPGAAGNWEASLDQALGRGSWRLEELTVNYRTPGAVVRAAQRLAHAAGLPVGDDVAAREVRGALMEAVAEDPVAAAVERALAALPKGETGRIALIAAGPDLDAARAAVAAGPLRDKVARPGENPLDFPLAVLEAGAAKGLEFDEVILVDPDRIASAAGVDTEFDRRAGAADLYVAMTRPTRRLWIYRRP